MSTERDRGADGRARNARARDDLGRPLDEHDPVAAPDEAALAPDAALVRAQQLLDAGQPFAAHEVLEAVWKAAPPPERELWRGLAQLAVGITHAKRGNVTGACSLLRRAADSLAPYDALTPHRVDVAEVRRWAALASTDLTRTADPPQLRIGP